MMDAYTLPIIFIALAGLSILIYAVLDGYDLGVGILLPMNSIEEPQRDTMIASIGPFWDANGTWLVLAIGLLLIAFPGAYGLILANVYLPVAVMLIGLIMRGVSFDFRAKAALDHKLAWDRCFKTGSFLAAISQGYMLGMYVMGFDNSWESQAFALLSAFGVTAAFSYIGGAWLIMKAEGELQQRAVRWTRFSGRCSFIGVVAVSLVNPLVNPGVFSRWFEYPLVMFVLLIPALIFSAFIVNDVLLGRLPKPNDRHCWVPFTLVVCIFILCFSAFGFSFFPEIVPGMTIWEAASAPKSLRFILWGTIIVLPFIIMYTALSYRVFHGKATELHYH